MNLPERAAAVHLPADDARHLLGELVGATRRCEADVAHVVVQVELGVVDPVRVVQ